LAAGSISAFFLIIDSAFLAANLTKIAEGGYVPLILAISVYGVMWTWHGGAAAISVRLHEALIPVPEFLDKLKSADIPRVPGTAVFLTRTDQGAPPVMVWHVKHNRALHEHVFVLHIEILSVPWVAPSDRLTIEEVATDFWRAEARFGFMERPHIPELFATSKSLGCPIDLDDVTYYVGHETVVGREDGKGLPAWQEQFFAVMERNAIHVSDFSACQPIRSLRSDGKYQYKCARASSPPALVTLLTAAGHFACSKRIIVNVLLQVTQIRCHRSNLGLVQVVCDRLHDRRCIRLRWILPTLVAPVLELPQDIVIELTGQPGKGLYPLCIGAVARGACRHVGRWNSVFKNLLSRWHQLFWRAPQWLWVEILKMHCQRIEHRRA
jgi:hypothetical protein